jgi:Protein of unknown function (DUF429)
METTLGIDLASQPANTALCVVAWGPESASVRALARGVWDEALLTDELLADAVRGAHALDGGWGAAGRPVKVGIDAPFGWPEPFADALAAHARMEPWPAGLGEGRARFERRATDVFVWERAKKLPLSVSTDRIAYPAMRCAAILGALQGRLGAAAVARDGSGVVAEAYPDAALRRWLPDEWIARETSYKGAAPAARARRERLVATLRAALGARLALSDSQHARCCESDDCLDALVCALVARAVQLGSTIPPGDPEQRRLALVEGWIHLPAASLASRPVV